MMRHPTYEFHTDFHSYRLISSYFGGYSIDWKFRLENDSAYRIKTMYKTLSGATKQFQKLFFKETGRPWIEYEDYIANPPEPFKMTYRDGEK